MKQALLVILAIAGLSITQAQVVERSKERATDKTNDRIDQRVDQGIDKGLDAIEGLFKKKNKKGKSTDSSSAESTKASENGNAKVLGKGDVKESYSFDHELELTMQEISKKGKQGEAISYTLLISDNEAIIGTRMVMEGVSASSIVDLDNNQVVTLTDQPGMKMGMAMGFDPKEFATSEEDPNQITPEATGESKEILGYTCYQYVDSNEDGEYEWWVTEEEDLQWMMGLATAAKNPNLSKGEVFTGMMMEMNMTDSKGKSYTTRVTEVKKNQKNTLSTTGYRFMNFGFGN